MDKPPSPYFIRRNAPPRDEEPFVVEEPMVHMEDETPIFLEYWRTVQKYLWLIVACTVVGGAALGLYAYTRTPLYSAQSTVLVEKNPPRFLNVQDSYSDQGYNWQSNFFKTQMGIMTSSALAAKAIRESGLENDPMFASQGRPKQAQGLTDSILTRLETRVKELLAGQPWFAAVRKEFARLHAEDAPEPVSSGKSITPAPDVDGGLSGVDSALVGRYRSGLAVEQVRETSLMTIAFTSTNPLLAAKLANIHAEAYQRYGLDLRGQANEDAMAFLEQKLVELKARVEKSEAALNAYRRAKGIISLDDKGNLTVERLADLNDRLTAAEARRIELESEVKAVEKRDYDAIPRVRDSGIISTLKGQVASLENEYSDMAQEFKPGYPPVDALKQTLDRARTRLRREIQSEINAITSAYRVAKANEEQLRAKMDEQKKATLNLKDAAVEYAYLAREVDTNRQLYDSVLQRMKELGVAAQIQQSNVSIVDRARPPGTPFYPNTQKSLLMGLFLGLVGGVGVAFFLDQLDTTIKTPDEVERYVNLPTLAVVPDFLKIKKHSNGYLPYQKNGTALQGWGGANGHSQDIVLAHHPHSVVAESYRTLRTAILLSRSSAAPRSILFTSASLGDGKTATSVNTSIIFAQMGYKVVVIDADMRRSRSHHVLEIANGVGLSEVLTGQRSGQEVIVPTQTENLYFLSSGAEPPNPAELVGSRKMRQLLEDLAEEYDFLIIDAPPVMPVSDPLLLSTMVDGVVIVVDSHKTPKKLVREVRSRLKSVNANLLGVVLNKVNWRRSDYSYHYKHYYSYYRG